MKTVKVILDRHDSTGLLLKCASMDAERENLGKTLLAALMLTGSQPGDRIVVKFEVPE